MSMVVVLEHEMLNGVLDLGDIVVLKLFLHYLYFESQLAIALSFMGRLDI